MLTAPSSKGACNDSMENSITLMSICLKGVVAGELIHEHGLMGNLAENQGCPPLKGHPKHCPSQGQALLIGRYSGELGVGKCV